MSARLTVFRIPSLALDFALQVFFCGAEALEKSPVKNPRALNPEPFSFNLCPKIVLSSVKCPP